MHILLMNTTNMQIIDINNVSNIAYLNGTVTVTYTGGSSTYSLNTYKIQILW